MVNKVVYIKSCHILMHCNHLCFLDAKHFPKQKTQHCFGLDEKNVKQRKSLIKMLTYGQLCWQKDHSQRRESQNRHDHMCASISELRMVIVLYILHDGNTLLAFLIACSCVSEYRLNRHISRLQVTYVCLAGTGARTNWSSRCAVCTCTYIRHS